MSWRLITESDLTTELSADELDTLRLALGAQSEDKIASTLQLLSAKLRDFIRTGGATLDATDYTLPEGLIADAVHIAIVRLSARAGGVLSDPKKLREKAADKAETFFEEKVATGKHSIEAPTTTATGAAANQPASPSFTAKTLNLRKTDQDGI